MYLAKVETQMFRGLGNFVCELNPGLNVLLGENNIGKSNLLDAIRLPLFSGTGPRDLWGRTSDISHDAQGKRLSDEFQIHLTFKNLTGAEPGLFSECLCPSLGPDVAQIHYRFKVEVGLDGLEKRNVKIWGGEREGRFSAEVLENIRLTFLPALRNAEADLRPGRTSRIARLLTEASESEKERQQLEAIVDQANKAISKEPLMTRAIQIVNNNLQSITGNELAQKADIALADPDFVKITGSMRLLVGDGSVFELEENGLGYNNLLYIASVLGELRRARRKENPVVDLAMLLIEEPEAHLHPQLQLLLASYLCQEASDGTVQVILTSHSPNIAARVPGESITVIHRAKVPTPGSGTKAKSLAQCGLDVSMLSDIRRYLDATKSTLFFARGVILVEGIAEALLLPLFAKQLGYNLEELGISVVNLNGLTFSTFAKLFAAGNIEVPCAVVTDADPGPDKAERENLKKGIITEEDLEPVRFPTALGRRSSTAMGLVASESGMVKVFLACKTLEWDLALESGNALSMAETYVDLRPELGAEMVAGIASATSNYDSAKVFFDGFDSKDKGRFAQRLAARLEKGLLFKVPDYLEKAIKYVAEGVKP